MPSTITHEHALEIPDGTTAQRPDPAETGMTRLNTESGTLEFFDGVTWISTNLIPNVDSVSGTIYSGVASSVTVTVTNATGSVIVRFSEGGVTLADVDDVDMSSGSASVTVPSAVYGQSAGDTIEVSVINEDGTPSGNSISKTVIGIPTGGTINTYSSYRSHTFTSSGTFNVPTGFSATADVLIVAGGGAGAGGNEAGGGGGAGGMLTTTKTLSSYVGSNTITVGGGGGATSGKGSNGSNSSALGTTATGGGAGGEQEAGGNYANSGGSGGGSGGVDGDGTYNSSYGGSGVSGQGHAGGSISDGGGDNGAGGGGKSEPGYEYTYSSTFDGRVSNADGTILINAAGTSYPAGMPGGHGATNNYRTGSNIYYAGGGAGGFNHDNNSGNSAFNSRKSEGGLGGGADSSIDSSGQAGSPNTGGGGSGGNSGSGNAGGGAGGSGIVVIRYQIS